MHRLVKIPVMVIGGIILAVVLAFVLGFVLQALWNWIMPEVFGLTEISYWQAWGLLILGHLLFGGGHEFKHERTSRRRKPREPRSELVSGVDEGPAPQEG
jgi:hypothetical protein